jgi:hypothetical protein
MNRFIGLMVLFGFVYLPAIAQQRMKLQKTLTLKIVGEGGSNGASIAWHPVLKKYYAAMAGNKMYPLSVFSEAGKLVKDGTLEEMIDVRGLWYNAKVKQIQGNGYDDNGWFEYKLNPSGLPTEVKILHEGQMQPNAQCVGTYNSATNEVYFFDGEVFFTYDAATAVEKSSITLDEIMEINDQDPLEGFEAFSQHLVMYTGMKGKEIALLNIELNEIELFNFDFKRTAVVAIPKDEYVYENFNCSYANGMFWFFDKDKREWNGYKPVPDGAASTAKTSGGGNTNPTLVPVTTNANAGGSNSGGKKATIIINSGELYSTADLKTSDGVLLSNWRSKYGTDKVDELVKRSIESGWPEKISTFNGRSEVRSNIANYKAYRVAALNDNKSLLWIPAAENKHMPQGMIDSYDFYFVIGDKGLQLGDLVDPFSKGAASGKEPMKGGGVVSVAPVQTGNDFASQLNAIVADYANGFKNIKGDLLPKENDVDIIKKYKSKIALRGTSKSYLSAGFGNTTLSYIAECGEDAPKEDIRMRFQSIVNQVDKVKFGCCTFVKNDEMKEDNLISQAYIPFDLNDKMGKAYDGLIVDVVMMKYISFDAEKQNHWTLFLRVYKLED